MNPAPIKDLISFEDFEKLDIRVGTILSVCEVEKSNKLMKLMVDFGAKGGGKEIRQGVVDKGKIKRIIEKFKF